MKKPLIAITVIFALLLFWAMVSWQPTAGKHGAHQLVATEDAKGGDFTLHSTSGTLSLHDYRGKVVLLYFGYTSCPDICPTSLGITSQALAMLDKEELDKVQMLFVTVDPARDSLDKLKAYTAYFHPGLFGLTGTPEEIAKAAKSYGAVYARQETGSAGGYVVDHSAYTYVIAPDGNLFKSLGHGTPPSEVIETIRAAMKKS